jgi:serine/threonine protein kinase
MGLEYGYEIDMWSLGCILCELLCGIPIYPGENEYDMMYYIMEYIGIPPKELIFKSHKKRNYFTDNGEPLEKPTSFGKIRKPNKKSFEKFLKNADNDFIDLIKKIFKWKKEERITPEEALKHTWIIKNMNEKLLFEHFNKIKNFIDYDYCCSLFVNEIKNFDFDDNMNEKNNKRKTKDNNEETSNFVASFNCSFNNENINSLKRSNSENDSKDDNNIFDDNIHINSSPRFASKIENSKDNIK